MSKALFVLSLALIVMLSLNPIAPAQTLTSFDPPGSDYTEPLAIGPTGQIVGRYHDAKDASGVFHTFLRKNNGTFFSVDPPGSISAVAQAVNGAGQIVGWYQDTSGPPRGFLRKNDGTFVSFDVGKSGTYPRAINRSGVITGESDGHGFLRKLNGTIVLFDAGTNGTYPAAITRPLAIVGSYRTNAGLFRGFLRKVDGTIISFDAGPNCTYPQSISEDGIIGGYYCDANLVLHGFGLWSPDGTLTSVDAPKGTFRLVVRFWMAGSFFDANATGVIHGFLQEPDGTIILIDPPGSVSTLPNDVGLRGQVVGSYSDGRQVHGFLWRR